MLTLSKQSSPLLTTVCSFCDKISIHFNCTQLSHITLSLKRSKMWIHNWPQPQAFHMFERQGVGGWGVWVLDTFSFTVYDPGQEDFNFPSNHSSRGPRVWGNPQTTIKPFISGPRSHHTPFCSNLVYKAFPLFYISWINCKISQPLPVPLVLSWEVPLPSVGSTRLLWFLTGATWKCTVGTH